VPSVFRRITANWKLKTLAFALAVLLWTVVSAEQVTSNWIWVPLEVQVTDPEYQVQAPEVRDVQVRFTGPGRDLLDIAVRRPPLRLTIGNVDEESGSYALDPRMVQVPGQLAVNALDVRPSAIRLEFMRVDTRMVPVRVRVANQLGDEWAIVDTLHAEPDRVRVSGPLSRLAEVTELPTVPIELTPADTALERVVALDSAGLRGLTLSTRRVTVRGAVDRIVDRVIADVPIDVGSGVTIRPTGVDVHLRGPRRAVEAIDPAVFRVVVSLDEIPGRVPPEGVDVPLRVDRMRPGVQAVTRPAQVRLYPGGTQPDTLPGEGPVPIGVPAGGDPDG
jgi:YbbR domain-containing protein